MRCYGTIACEEDILRLPSDLLLDGQVADLCQEDGLASARAHRPEVKLKYGVEVHLLTGEMASTGMKTIENSFKIPGRASNRLIT